MKALTTTALGVSMILTSLMVPGGCGSAATADGDSSEGAATTTQGDCEIFGVQKQAALSIKDLPPSPVVAKILKDTCPGTYAAIQAKLNMNDKCALAMRNVSERAVQLNTEEVGRALVSRTCGSSDPELFFLLDPIDTRTTKVPDAVEVIGVQDGVFNYYAREPKSSTDTTMVWKFYGTSADIVNNGYNCDTKTFNGACQALLARDGGVSGNKSGVRCASCHPGGGLVQKELNSPWTSWQDPRGGDAWSKANIAIVGPLMDGLSFEPITTKMNTAWAKKRLALLQKKTVKDLLRPLFCTMDINLQAAGSTTVESDFFLDPIFGNSTQVQLNADIYKTTIGKNEQQIGGKGLEKKHDTSDIFMYPERSGLDQAYVAALSSVVGASFVRDVLFVDFTRPIFSPTRCGLLDAVDGVTDVKSAPADILKNALAKKLDGAAELQAAMASKEAASSRHNAEVGTYMAACAARAKTDPAFTVEAVTYQSHLRRVAHGVRVKLAAEKTKPRSGNPTGDFGIIDFDETLPTDKLDTLALTQPAFSQDTCTLKQ